jgi:hypothetical protein
LLFFTFMSYTLAAQDTTAYRYYLGTNFDFIDGLDAKGLYHHVNITLPKAFSDKSGFIGGIYQSRQNSLRDTVSYLNRGTKMRQYTALPSTDPSQVRIVLVDSPMLEKVTMTKSLGLYFEPVRRLFANSDASTVIYGLGHLEYVRRNFEERYTSSSKPSDTLLISKADLVKYPSMGPSQVIKYRRDEGYFGVGAMVYHKNTLVEIQVKGMVGAANLDKWRLWYGVDVSVMEMRSKFTLCASYKGLLPDQPPYYLNVSLSKVFYLSKIGELLN